MSPFEATALIIAGVAIGAYATAIGAGGGFLLTPLLLVIFPDQAPEFITTASLSVVAISSGLSSVVGMRHGRVDGPVAALLAAIAVPGALIGASGTQLVPRDAFAVGVAVLLLVLAIYLIWRPAASVADPVVRGWRREVSDGEGNTFVYRIPVGRSIAPTVGTSLVAALAGIGGGVFYVPLATRVMRMPHTLAVPLAHIVITTLAVTVVAFHLAAGDTGEPLRAVPWLAAGMLAANPVGQRLNRRLGEGPLTRLLAAGLLAVAVRTAWSVF